MVKEDKEWIKHFLNRDELAIKEFYHLYREPFTDMLYRYQIDSQTAEDIYQESVLALFNNIIEKKYNPELASIKTYLLGIGKFISLNRIKKNNKHLKNNLDFSDTEFVSEEQDLTIEQKKLRFEFEKLGPKCKEVLKLFYYRGLTNSEIVELGYYPNENTVKSHKSRCLRQLRKMVKD